MSALDVFSRRYADRIGSGLFDEDLYLHDHKLVEDEGKRLSEAEEDIENRHYTEELKLREQIRLAIDNANEARSARNLDRRAWELLADVYLQSGDAKASVARKDLSWLWTKEGGALSDAPIHGDKRSLAARLLIFDFLEAFFDLLPPEAQLEFSRDLNQRLHRGASRWYFQLGRWRRDDWPRERDSQLDTILHGLKRQADYAARRHVNEAELAELDDDQALKTIEKAQAEAREASDALMKAARDLWTADRLLDSDLLSGKVRHKEAVKLARRAFDECVEHFKAPVMGPFVNPRAAAQPKRRGLFTKPEDELEEDVIERESKKMDGVRTPQAAALRIKQLGHFLLHDHDKERRDRLLRRLPLAEFLLRVVVFGPEKETALYSRATRAEGGLIGFESYSHGRGTVDLLLEDANTARLAVDILARLCLFSTGAEDPFDDPRPPMKDPLTTHDHRRKQAEKQKRGMLVSRVFTIGLVCTALLGGAFGLGWLSAKNFDLAETGDPAPARYSALSD